MPSPQALSRGKSARSSSSTRAPACAAARAAAEPAGPAPTTRTSSLPPVSLRLTAMEFRPAVATDVPQIVALVESAYRGEASRAGWTTEADLLEGQRTDPQGVAEIVASPEGLLLLAFEGS